MQRLLIMETALLIGQSYFTIITKSHPPRSTGHILSRLQKLVKRPKHPFHGCERKAEPRLSVILFILTSLLGLNPGGSWRWLWTRSTPPAHFACHCLDETHIRIFEFYDHLSGGAGALPRKFCSCSGARLISYLDRLPVCAKPS